VVVDGVIIVIIVVFFNSSGDEAVLSSMTLVFVPLSFTLSSSSLSSSASFLVG